VHFRSLPNGRPGTLSALPLKGLPVWGALLAERWGIDSEEFAEEAEPTTPELVNLVQDVGPERARTMLEVARRNRLRCEHLFGTRQLASKLASTAEDNQLTDPDRIIGSAS
jgi:hypothetical protein